MTLFTTLLKIQCEGLIDSFNTVGSPGTAKNIITVGSIFGNKLYEGAYNTVTDYSGRGNSLNNRYTFLRLSVSLMGRYLPTVVATGDEKSAKSLSVEDCGHSCSNHVDTTLMQGTYPIHSIRRQS